MTPADCVSMDLLAYDFLDRYDHIWMMIGLCRGLRPCGGDMPEFPAIRLKTERIAMRLERFWISLRYWFCLVGTGAVLLGSVQCLPTSDQLRYSVQTNLLGTATAVIDFLFITAANALLNTVLQ